MENSSIVVTALQDILTWAGHHVVEIIIFLSLFLEISKIKINPISALIKFIFRPIRKEINDMKEEIKNDMDELKNDLTSQINSLRKDQEKEKEAIDELIYSNEMSEISRIRWEIIEFASSIGNGQLHVRDEYRHIKDDYKKYEKLIDKYELDDGAVSEDMEKINEHYNENKDTTSVFF